MASPIFSHPIWALTLHVLSSNRLDRTNIEASDYPDLDQSALKRSGILYIHPSLQNPFLRMLESSMHTDTSSNTLLSALPKQPDTK